VKSRNSSTSSTKSNTACAWFQPVREIEQTQRMTVNSYIESE
jgi:hypothetical protein